MQPVRVSAAPQELLVQLLLQGLSPGKCFCPAGAQHGEWVVYPEVIRLSAHAFSRQSERQMRTDVNVCVCEVVCKASQTAQLCVDIYSSISYIAGKESVSCCITAEVRASSLFHALTTGAVG